MIIDLDGTLFNSGTGGWEQVIMKSPVNRWCKELVDVYYKTHTIILLTARLEIYRELTEKRLYEIGVYPFQYVLHMYPGDRYRFRSGNPGWPHEFKTRVIRNELLQKYEILLAVDDEPENVSAIRSLGIMCLQC